MPKGKVKNLENTATSKMNLGGEDGRLRLWAQFAFRYFVVFAPFSLIWEFAHMPLYTLWQSGTVGQIILYGLHCTGGDILIALSALTGAVVLFGRSNWPTNRSALVLGSMLLFGLGYTIYSEWLNTVVRESWGYSDLMPVLPPLGTGLTPMLQWIFVPLVSYVYALRYVTRPTLREK